MARLNAGKNVEVGAQKRYHKDVYMPNLNFENFFKRITSLVPTKHFLDRVAEKGLPIPTIDEVAGAEVFEVYTTVLTSSNLQGIEKVVVKIYGKTRDVCFVISRRGTIVTGWWRAKGDELKQTWLYDID